MSSSETVMTPEGVFDVLDIDPEHPRMRPEQAGVEPLVVIPDQTMTIDITTLMNLMVTMMIVVMMMKMMTGMMRKV